jgi:hypothetical protein
MATEVDDCPQEAWKTTPCPQNMPETQGDCLKVHDLECRVPLAPRPSSQAAGPKKYNRVRVCTSVL